jgi:hypothetical protein
MGGDVRPGGPSYRYIEQPALVLKSKRAARHAEATPPTEQSASPLADG